MASLGEWKHINCLLSTAQYEIQDDVLRKLVHTKEPKAKPSGQPISQLDSLLDAVDLENIMAMDEKLTVRDVPGGTVSFLFAKSSVAEIEPVAESDEI